jgi:glucosamine-6-phosphate deaminase
MDELRRYENLLVEICPDNASLGKAAAQMAARLLAATLAQQPVANLVLATGNSQLSFLEHLGAATGIDWSRVNIFHMDEYAGMPADHPASFRRFLRQHLVDTVHPAAFYGVRGEATDLQAECARYAGLLLDYPPDICCLGIGENGHLAFNDPPFADFKDPEWVKIVQLDERSRQQQVGEGHFPALADVPRQAITLTIPALLSAWRVLAIVPEQRKAEAVFKALTGPMTTACPASVLRITAHAHLFLDKESAALLD